MNLNRLQSTLMSSARRNPPSDSVPYGFEARVMARVRGTVDVSVVDVLADWTRGFWRAAVSSVGVFGVALALHVSQPASSPDWADSMESFSADLDAASVAQGDSTTDLW